MDDFNYGNNNQPQNDDYTPAENNTAEPMRSQSAPSNRGYYGDNSVPPMYSQPVQEQYYIPPQQYNQPVTLSAEEKPRKNKNKTIVGILVVLAICIVVAIAGTIAAYLGNSDADTGNDSNTSQSQSKDGDYKANVESSGETAKKDADGNLTAAGVAQNNMDSCVGITVYAAQSAYDYFYSYGYGSNSNGGEVKAGTGSGVIMSESKGKTYIMTAAHVISDGTKFTVTLNNDEEYDAEVVGIDSQTDIGVLSIQKTGLKVAKFGNSDDIEVGEGCVAIGCPGGLEFKNSVTQGIVSAVDRPVESSIGYDTKCIQVDAAINPGNSGGALFNMQGQVIGINSSKIASTEYEGMGFAVPSNTAVNTANSLIEHGYVAGRAKLGLSYLPLSSFNNASAILAELDKQGYKDAQGTMVVQEIDENSNLKNSDLQKYDMIVAVNGKTMTSTDVVTSLLSESKPGDTITLTIARVDDDRIKTFDIKCKLIESKE